MSAEAFDPDDTPSIGRGLLEALSRQGISASLPRPPSRLGGGLDTYVYAFRLTGDCVEAEWARPLVLRIYPSPDQAQKAEREFAVQQFVAGRGFPAPRPLLVEPGGEPFGLPFMVMERMPGTPLLDRLKNPFLIPRVLSLLADTHARLHDLSADGWPLPHDGPLVGRILPVIEDLAERFDLKGPRRALGWLRARAGFVQDEELAICHTDFHPLNVLLDRRGRVSVVDWSDANVGDRHSDLAGTTALFWLAPPLARTRVERTVLTWLRGYTVSGYLRRYEQHHRVDRERLRYWQALHATYAWTRVLALHKEGPAAMGARAGAQAEIPQSLTFALKSYISERMT